MKKFILFIVEGHNDALEIQAILRTPFFTGFMKNFEPQFKIMGKDITMEATGKKNIRNVVGEKVRSWKNGDTAPFNPIKNVNIQEIIQIVDMDGAGVPEYAIVEDNVGGFIYEDEIIRARKAGQVIQRNAIKKKNLKILAEEVDQIDNLPYHVYFASCNMDHVISNQRNPSQKYKNSFAYDYGNLCKSKPEIIFNSILSKEIGTNLSYQDSWIDILTGTNSLKRKTNLNLFFEKYGEF